METVRYENIIPSHNRSMPKNLARILSVVGQSCDLESLIESYLEAFDLDKATGKQLDAIGALVGASRILPFAPVSGLSRELDDETYRMLIRARIAINHWDGTNEGLQNALQSLFPSVGMQLVDEYGEDRGSFTIVITGSVSDLVGEMINASLLVPRPAGIKMTYEVSAAIPIAYAFGSSKIAQTDENTSTHVVDTTGG